MRLAMMAVQIVVFYGILIFAVWKIVTIGRDTKEIKAQLAELRRAMEEKR